MKSIKVKTTDLSVTVRVAYQFSFDHNFVQLTKMFDVFAIKLASTKNIWKGCIWLSDIILKEGQK